MITAERFKYSNNSVRIKPVALPVEHGGWGLLSEPIALGLLVAPSLPGILIGLAAVGAFLTRQPFKLLVGDFRRNRRLPRTDVAIRFVLVYALASAACLFAATAITANSFLVPLLVAAPFVGVQLFYDVSGKTRQLIPEITSSVALGAIGASIVLADGGTVKSAYGVWLIMAARSLPSILYLRARLAESHNKPVSLFPALAANLVALVGLFALADRGLVPVLAVVPIAVLTFRAVGGLLRPKAVPAKTLGIQELILGAVTVLVVATGFWLGY